MVLWKTAGMLALGLASAVATLTVPARANEPSSCQTVHLADIGWSDNTVQNAVFTAIAQYLDYEVQSTSLSTQVMYESMKTGRVDVFLDQWMPTEEALTAPYYKTKSIDRLGPDLTGAKYTLVVPDFLYQEGLKSVTDIGRFGDQLDHKIYGLESGNTGNQHILAIIADKTYGLTGFQLVQSSESGMLAEAARKIPRKRGIVSLGWAPHPMNVEFKIDYLSGADAYFGPNEGEATVYIATRHGYAAQCPNLGRLLTQFRIAVADEDSMMYDVQIAHKEPQVAARAWLKANPQWIDATLSGVTTVKGKPGAANVEATLETN